LVAGALGLPVGDHLAVGLFGLLGERFLAGAHVAQRVAGGAALLAAAGGQSGLELQRAQLLGGQRGAREGVVLARG
jgi:hypothetical protein